MKTYKTWEVFKMALEKPQLRVKRLSDGQIYKLGNERIEPEGKWDEFSTIKVDEEWTLVKEPPKSVDFIEAYAVYKKGGCIIREDKQKIFGNYRMVKGEDRTLFNTKDIESKWIIQEDEE